MFNLLKRIGFKNGKKVLHQRVPKEAQKFYRKFCVMLLTIAMLGVNILCGVPVPFKTVCAEDTVYPIAINETNFPDENFRTWVAANIPHANADYLTANECAAVTIINVLNKQITSLSGIQYFTHLNRLSCGTNQIKQLDVSANTELKLLSVFNNQLETLDIKNNKALTALNCYGNKLTVLDVRDNVELTDLICIENQLDSLDLNSNINLVDLRCGDNKLTTLDVSKNPALIDLGCENNHLTTLDLSQNTQIMADSVFCDSQTTTVSFKGGNTVDMNNVVGSENLGNVSLPEGAPWSYDATAGVMTYTGTGSPESLVYNYDTGFAYEEGNKLYMDVTVTLSLSSFTVTFHPNNGEDSFQQLVYPDEKVSAPINPTRTNYNFSGWYTSTDNGVTLSSDLFDFDTSITANTDLYAQWALIDSEAPSDAEIPADIEVPSVVATGDNDFINICILISLLFCAGAMLILSKNKKENVYE